MHQLVLDLLPETPPSFDNFVVGANDEALTGLMVAGCAAGALLGIRLGKRMAGAKDLLTKLFALVVIGTGLYVTASGWPALSALASAG